ncbi:MAG: tetratricopeptide repeat protein [Gemmatimonadales bacterium]
MFRSSDDYDEQAHQLYNQARYDEALEVLKEGLAVYPSAVELYVGAGYAYLAREDYVWARGAFTQALFLEPDHEDGLAGHGETLLRIGDVPGALQAFERVLTLGFSEDHDLMLQIGRALFREGRLAQAYRYFELAASAEPDCEEAAACMGYVSHRLGREGGAIFWLRRALAIDPTFAEPRIYLANLLYDRGETAAALIHFERTDPQEHFDELGLFRTIELKKTFFRLADDDPSLETWYQRVNELLTEPDPTEEMLAELEAMGSDGSIRDPNQLELFGTMLTELQEMHRKPGQRVDHHQVATLAGQTLKGTWDEILLQLKAADRNASDLSVTEFMQGQALRGKHETGVEIPLSSPEAFIRGAAEAGVLRIVH